MIVKNRHMEMPEVRASLLLSRTRLSAEAAETVRGLLSKGLDWESLASFSIRHGTANIIYKNLLMIGDAPDGVLETLESHYHSTLGGNIRLLFELDRIIDGLAERDVPVITLKGPVTSDLIFGDIGMYPSGDIDILVKVKDLDATRSFLESRGYQLCDEGFDEYREFYIKELYHISFSNGKYAVEPHWNLFFRYFTSTPEFWWDGRVPVSSGGRTYTFLSPEKNILYNSFRLYSKSFDQLRFLVMVAELVRHYKDEIDWDRLFHYAAEHKFENVLRVTMKLSSDLLGAPAPDGYSAIKGFIPRILYRYIRRIVLKGENERPLNKIVMSLLRDDMSGAFRVLFRRLFPSMGEIVMRYGLPVNSGKAMIYYMLNPLFLMLRRHHKA